MNLRDATFTESSGKNVKSTKQLSNGAKLTKAFTAKNSTKEYDNGGKVSPGPLGGRNTMK